MNKLLSIISILACGQVSSADAGNGAHELLSGAAVLAIHEGKPVLLGACIESGFDVNRPIPSTVPVSISSNLPLHFAVSQGRLSIVNMILHSKADAAQRDERNATAMYYCHNSATAKALARTDVRPTLIGAAAEVVIKWGAEVSFMVDSEELPLRSLKAAVEAGSSKHVYGVDEMDEEFKHKVSKLEGRKVTLKLDRMTKTGDRGDGYSFELSRSQGVLGGKFISGTVVFRSGWWVAEAQTISEG